MHHTMSCPSSHELVLCHKLSLLACPISRRTFSSHMLLFSARRSPLLIKPNLHFKIQFSLSHRTILPIILPIPIPRLTLSFTPDPQHRTHKGTRNTFPRKVVHNEIHHPFTVLCPAQYQAFSKPRIRREPRGAAHTDAPVTDSSMANWGLRISERVGFFA